MQTLSSFKLFTQPMDRAEVLHVSIYDLNGRRKILLAKTHWFFHEKSLIFDRIFTYMSGPTCNSTCPLPQRVLFSKMTSRLYEPLPRVPATLILRQHAVLRFFKCLSGLEIYNFHEISVCEHPTGAPMQTLSSFKRFTQPMDRADVLHAPIYHLSGRQRNIPGENDQVLS